MKRESGLQRVARMMRERDEAVKLLRRLAPALEQAAKLSPYGVPMDISDAHQAAVDFLRRIQQ